MLTGLMRRLLWGIALCFSISAAAAPDKPLVAAASDLQFALSEIAQQFQIDRGHAVELVFGSSGNFYRQIIQGAPFQLYLSADESYVEELFRQGKTRDQGALYAIGRIVLIAPHESKLKVDSELNGLKAALRDGQISRFAIANPEHAPYGLRAEEALQYSGLWEALQGKLVLGENVAQAAQFATSGNAQGGIIAYSLALSPAVAKRVEVALIPQEWHKPLHQRMVLMKNASNTAVEFYNYLQEPGAREIMRTYGFNLPDTQ